MKPRYWRAHLWALVMVASAGLGLGGCAGASAGLGTSSASCFTGLPPAYHVVGRGAKLLGVRLESVAKARSLAGGVRATENRDLCVLIFQLPGPDGRYTITHHDEVVLGNFKVVIYSLQTESVLRVRHRSELPSGFAHAVSVV